MYDVVIVGAGVVGCAAARYLSRYALKVCVLEKEEDVCCGTSKANSAIVHTGFDAVPGTNKARYNVRGNEMMEPLCQELDVPFRRNGSLVEYSGLWEQPVRRLRATFPTAQSQASVAETVRTLCVQAPVSIGDVICDNIAGTGVALVCAKNVVRREAD